MRPVVKYIFNGNLERAKEYVPVAQQQIDVLLNIMKYNNLKQSNRTVQLRDGSVVKLAACFDLITVDITGVTTEERKKYQKEQLKLHTSYDTESEEDFTINSSIGGVKDISCLGYSIEYTTNTMGLSESQIVSCSSNGESYDSDLDAQITNSGSGSLVFLDYGGTDGFPRWTLTAPASNPGCDNPADLTLTVCGEVADNVRIAVNSYSPEVVAETLYAVVSSSCILVYTNTCCFQYTKLTTLCGGNSTVQLYTWNCHTEEDCVVCNEDQPANDVWVTGLNSARITRTPAMIAAGCCPGDLL